MKEGGRDGKRGRKHYICGRTALSPITITAQAFLTSYCPSYVSPRKRAQRTLELLDIGCRDAYPWHQNHPTTSSTTATVSDANVERQSVRCEAKVHITPLIREWDYGDYEGLTSAQIREHRRSLGLRGEAGAGEVGSWDIWKDGCEGGEGPVDVTKRLDALIAEIRERWHRPVFDGGKGPGDVLIVAHGHILRAFAHRWVGKELEEGWVVAGRYVSFFRLGA